ncbi:hypothetical protein HRH59_11095 [Rheinheimera sp. YQF-2]|uniref:SIR2-like domain-containing protein n=1 Tax=Rheinheimera lutimaris TaxID=2740584 RepID=A0A7Y5AR95_9GAMM|nr:hypothetical protein [Rheinheimera lutimaris]NRQ43091.1 hypothetical protein [Rheinheimera lutimaris]
MDLKTLLNKAGLKPALVIGNGINRYNSDDKNNSWEKLLIRLWSKRVGTKALDIPIGISLTEFYDALDLTSEKQSKSLQVEFCELMAKWQVKPQHKLIVEWASKNNAPILTTNFESTLSDVFDAKIKHLEPKKFTDYYPWGSYYSPNIVKNISDDFGIWHINGLQKYSRSIRLGLSHYMGAVERARPYLHRGNDRLFKTADVNNWLGKNTWLNIFFKNDLIFFGLALDSAEIFLRWLLIERAKFFKKHPQCKREGYYFHVDKLPLGQKLFLESIGFKIIQVTDYIEIYENPWQ